MTLTVFSFILPTSHIEFTYFNDGPFYCIGVILFLNKSILKNWRESSCQGEVEYFGGIFEDFIRYFYFNKAVLPSGGKINSIIVLKYNYV